MLGIFHIDKVKFVDGLPSHHYHDLKRLHTENNPLSTTTALRAFSQVES